MKLRHLRLPVVLSVGLWGHALACSAGVDSEDVKFSDPDESGGGAPPESPSGGAVGIGGGGDDSRDVPEADDCAGGQTCGGSCVDTVADNQHCGACNNSCSPGRSCSGGHCVCNTGHECDGTCVDTGHECGGTCVDTGHECGGTCVDTGHCGAIPAGDRTFYIAPHGNDNAAGTESAPFATLNHAVNIAQPGDVFVMRGGTYRHDVRIDIGENRDGTAQKPIHVVNYPGEVPVFNFEAQQEEAGRDGIRLNASYWRLMGLHLTRAGGNGFRIHGSHNVIERCVAFENRLTGIHLEDGSHNLVRNNDSYRNFNRRGRVGNMADGFAAKYEALGPGNVFYGNRSWENSDDGFDFWRATSPIVLENNWAFGNGNGAVFGNPTDFDGGGNGFKLGGDHLAGNHIVIRNMAFDNLGVSGNAKGFDHNNNTGALTLLHNSAFNNGRNYSFPNDPSNGSHIFRNNLSLVPGNVQIFGGTVQEGNSWQSGTPATSMFFSVDTDLAKSPRQADGSLPNIQLLLPRPESYLVDGGVDIGEPYRGAAPDIGAVEYTP